MGSNQGKEAIHTIKVNLWNFFPECIIDALSLRAIQGKTGNVRGREID